MTEPTQRQKSEVVRALRYYADQMGLKDWQFEVVFGDDKDDPAPSAFARTKIWSNAKTATVWVCDAFWGQTPAGKRELLVHELCHWHTEGLYQHARDLARCFGREAFDVAVASLDRAHEHTVDGISAAWAPKLDNIELAAKHPAYSRFTDVAGNFYSDLD